MLIIIILSYGLHNYCYMYIHISFYPLIISKYSSETSKKSTEKSNKVKISGVPNHVNKEMLQMFFEREENNGGGKVRNIEIDNRNKCSVVEFEDETGKFIHILVCSKIQMHLHLSKIFL